jgi:hypothetical protein
MEPAPTRSPKHLPERGRPQLARCEICGHRHACYVVDRPGQSGPPEPRWDPYFVCLGCLMRAADPAARIACADCVFPA